jgi:hypothetical protein
LVFDLFEKAGHRRFAVVDQGRALGYVDDISFEIGVVRAHGDIEADRRLRLFPGDCRYICRGAAYTVRG